MMTKKFLMLALCGGILVAADQAQYPILPNKQEIQQAVLESEVVKSQQLVPQLAPLIAAYADNAKRGFLTLTKYSRAMPLYCSSVGKGTTSEWIQAFSKEYPTKQLVARDWAVHNIFTTDDPEYIPKLDQDGWVKTIHTITDGTCYLFPSRIPLKFLESKKEGDEVRFTLQGIPYLLICSQRALNPQKPENFEDVLAKVDKLIP